MQYEIDDSILFYGVVKSTKRLVTLIKAMNISNESTCFIHDEGLTLTIEKSRTVRANAHFKKQLFHEFILKEGANIDLFGLPVDAFIDCLRAMLPPTVALGTLNSADSTHDYCEIAYDGTGSPFTLKRKIAEHGLTNTFSLKPSQPEDETPDLVINDTLEGSPQVMTLESRWLKDALEGFNKTTEKVTMTFSPDDISFHMTAEGTEVTTEEELEKDALPFITFNCGRELTFSYLYSHIILCKKALNYSDEVNVEMYDSGSLRMMFKLAGQNNIDDYIEFSFLKSISDA